ncbi:extracellular solute-binding protein [Caldilinea sp.]|uniref:extracellular solute-binding protein n=1 Tax=Caldilinea sp. TaxID=2293560 RepID=UPI002C259394|nr:extracellular solute-binding protein [Caldilinea sp.]
MFRHKMTVMLSVLVLLSMVLSACTVAAPAPQPAAPAAESGEASWWRTASQAAGCEGVTIRGVSESTPPSRYAAEVLAASFEAETGIKVELEATSWDEMYSKAINDMQANTGIYDFVYIEQDIIYQYLANDYLTNLTQLLADNPELASPDFDFAKFTSFIDNFKDADGNIYGVPMEAFLKIYLYRLDLFNDPAIQEAFKAQYGYDLAPATTHQQYQDIADFFTQYGKDNDMELWGTTVQGNTGHASSFYEFFESIAPTFGVYNWGINQDTWKASVENGGEMNSDASKEALAFWVGLLADAPPEATASTWDEVAASFAAGRAAQGWVYGENAAWIATDPERSKVVGNVGVALPPVAEGVMADAESGAGYIGYYDGGAFGLPVSSKNPLCTLLWMQYVGQESVQADWAIAGSRIVMESTYDDPKVQEVDAKVDGYYTLMREAGPLFRGAPPFPFHSALREVVQPFIWKALSGELTPAEALDQAAAAADAELVNLGYGQ